ncbi:hypothetical protein KAI54_02965 [Candidatus Gracilibacteria bacterium]|nr:hypothetical protein [Candidatus Gracilibacteria bacterium]
MKCSEVIKTAWRMTNNERGLVWYGVIPAFFGTLVGIGYLVYQFLAFRSSPFFGAKEFDFNKIESFVLGFAGNHPTLAILFVVSAVIVGILYFILPPFCEGGIIGLTSAIYKKKEGVKSSDGIAIGAHHFLRMFEFRMVIGSFGFIYFLTVISLTIRKLGTPSWLVFFLGFIFLASLVMSFLFIYAQNFIVLENRKLIPSFSGSAQLVISNFGKTILMWLLMLLISIRVVINVVLIFLIPALVAFVANFFVSVIAFTFGIVLATLVGFAVILLASYLAGVLHVFTTAAWTLTFLNLDSHRVEKLLEK